MNTLFDLTQYEGEQRQWQPEREYIICARTPGGKVWRYGHPRRDTMPGMNGGIHRMFVVEDEKRRKPYRFAFVSTARRTMKDLQRRNTAQFSDQVEWWIEAIEVSS